MKRSLPLHRWTILLLIVLSVHAVSMFAESQPAHAEGSVIDDARAAYEQASWQRVVDILAVPLANGTLSDAEKQLALELTARADVRLGQDERARVNFKKLLRINPMWKPDQDVYPPNEYAAYEMARDGKKISAKTGAMPNSSQASTPSQASSKKWWIAGGAAAIAVVIAIEVAR